MNGGVETSANVSHTGRVAGLMALVARGRQLLENARASQSPDWQKLLQEEAGLRGRLEFLMRHPVGPEEVEAVRIALQELLAINTDLVALIEGYRGRALQALEHKALVRRAARAYGQSAVG
ncbi:hypothetical protein [Acidihalobacter prosperus]|uniref:Flagellar protein FliT n=1 Tax=Acidihalobacter prosperus TaxID=160660 RepID=A0A1A6C5I5_9GAMM|nr:hypothetical protein [Acidihalobacter prosperus]OBS09831.1 hypothetical protein Thpro_020881 [Acidihalobacter prosperus]